MDTHLFSELPLSAGRVAVGLRYQGHAYYGWQSQRKPQLDTVQDVLEAALGRVADSPLKVHCAGRTDAGVHASHQVVHFDTEAVRSEKAWVMGGSANLPGDIGIQWAKAVDNDFHARFSALARRYRYVIYNHPLRPVHLRHLVTWFERSLDAALMHNAAQALLGERDFSGYRAAGCQSLTPMRNVHFIEVFRRGHFVVIDIQANAFLHHMVRNIAGVLMAVGCGDADPGWVEEVLEGKDRRAGGVTARPDGLYLVDVLYPQHYGLPLTVAGPEFLQCGAEGAVN